MLGKPESSAAGSLPAEYRFAGFRLDVRRRQLIDPGGRVLAISSRAFETLLALLVHAGEPVSKAHLMTTVWPGSVVEENNLSQAISSLRKALGDSSSPRRFIKTIAGRGYCFIMPLGAEGDAGHVRHAAGRPPLWPAWRSAGRAWQSLAAAVLIAFLAWGGLTWGGLVASRPSGDAAREFSGSIEAYRYFLAAENAYYFQDYEKTWTLARRAVEVEPDYIDAHRLFSTVNTVLVGAPLDGMSPRDHMHRAVDSAERVIALNPDGTEGYSLRASALSATGDWVRVAAEFEALLERGADLAELRFYALVLLSVGFPEAAIEVLEANLAAEPVNLHGRGFLMAALELTGEREKARREFNVGEELSPVWWGDTVNVFLDLGRRETLKDLDELGMSDALKVALLERDDPDATLRRLRKYSQQPDKRTSEAAYYSALAAYAGEHELAVELMRASVDGVALNTFWYWLPVFDETRRKPEFRQFLVDFGVVRYWRANGWPRFCQPLDAERFECEWESYPGRAEFR